MKRNVKNIKSKLAMLVAVLALPVGMVQAQDYCIPNFEFGCDDGMNISSIYLAGETVTLDNESDCSNGTHGDYTSLDAPDLIPGNTYVFQLGISYNLFWQMSARGWIDFNDNGEFEDDEEFITSFGANLNTNPGGENGLAAQLTSFVYTVPADAAEGVHRMRIRLLYNSQGFDDIAPCDEYMFGETEDYEVLIGEGEPIVSCSGTPDAGTIDEGSTLAVCSGIEFSLTVSDASEGSGISYQWQERTPAGTGVWTDIAGETALTLTVQDILEETDYRLVVVCDESEETATTDFITISLNGMDECYCVPEMEEGCDEGETIERVFLDGESSLLDNESACSVDAYGDFTNLGAPDLMAGKSYDIEVTSTTFPEDCSVRVWIDLGNNGTFDTDELMASLVSIDASGTSALSMEIPAEAPVGIFRMRVRLLGTGGEDIDFDACSDDVYGETEDYMVEIVENPSLGINELASSLLKVYPNPASEKVTIENSADANLKSIALYDITGKELFVQAVDNQSIIQLDVTKYNAGIYFIKIQLNNGELLNQKIEVFK